MNPEKELVRRASTSNPILFAANQAPMNAYTNFAFIDGLGAPRVLMIAFIALLLFGGKNLPSLARTMGRTLREFKNASNEVQREIRKAIDDAPDPDRPAQPVSTIAQHQAMPTQPPMPAELGLVDSGYDGAGENSAPCSPRSAR